MRVRFSHPALLRSLTSFGSFAVHSTRKKKKPRYGGFFTTTLLRGLFNSVLQCFRSAEFGHAHRLDLDGCSCAGVPAHAAGARLCLKNAETCDGDLLTLLEGVGNHRDDSLYRALAVGLRAGDSRRDPLH